MFGVAVSLRVEYGAIDALAAILLVDQSLVAVDHHNKVVVVRDREASHSLYLLTIEIHGILATEVADSKVNPLAVPALISHFFLKLLRC